MQHAHFANRAQDQQCHQQVPPRPPVVTGHVSARRVPHRAHADIGKPPWVLIMQSAGHMALIAGSPRARDPVAELATVRAELCLLQAPSRTP